MTYEIKIFQADFHQIAIGTFGSDKLPPAFIEAAEKKDASFFIRHCAPLRSLNTKGNFRRKRDAEKTAANLVAANHYGLGFKRAKTGENGHGILVEVK